MTESEKYQGYKWIKVAGFTPDFTKSWEELYDALAAHHVEETRFLIEKVRELAAEVDRLSGVGINSR